MMYRFILALAFFVATGTAFAHGPSQHVLGTVTIIDATHLEVKTQKGGTVDVQITKDTRFKEKGNPKGTNLPAAGDRVVIEATKENNLLTAIEVHFSAVKRAPQPDPASASTPAQPAPVSGQ